jgi:ankyrin repeat protein
MHNPRRAKNLLYLLILSYQLSCASGKEPLSLDDLYTAHYRELLSTPGFKINQPVDVLGQTHLHYAAMLPCGGPTRLLLEAGAYVNAQDANQWTPLHSAAYCGSFEAAKALLAYGANANLETNNGFTPLHALQALLQRQYIPDFSEPLFDLLWQEAHIKNRVKYRCCWFAHPIEAQ